MTTKVVIHAGFHKTGTTSVQSMLRENAKALEPHVRIFLKEHFEELTTAARTFSIEPREKTLARVAKAAAAFFAGLDESDPRPILMASEDLSGHMPGRHGLSCYDGAGLIMRCISVSAFASFGDEADVTFYFSTRERKPWLRSTWWQNLRSTRLTLDFEAYQSQFDDAVGLDDILTEIATDVAPARVTSQRLEDIGQGPFGPLDPILDLLDITEPERLNLRALPPENVQPDIGVDAVFLALNRSGLPEADIREAKRNIRKMARRLMP
ncbi:hypothetical protein [Marivita hallyeonensis]|uniref:Sulfotransferase family protein n=1 Tax=Marivita hallyeonensis TaxID=996342 RepID=A0A1M5XDE2_9RHOB|nr:hypothetical protein [Marivita hallyeonensis]SHH97885.1 hypothetical protein SAMN05443551_3872 [Marivita hallyeonensis]